jgi:hypothetical protein
MWLNNSWISIDQRTIFYTNNKYKDSNTIEKLLSGLVKNKEIINKSNLTVPFIS